MLNKHRINIVYFEGNELRQKNQIRISLFSCLFLSNVSRHNTHAFDVDITTGKITLSGMS